MGTRGDDAAGWALTALRCTVGAVMAAHGVQKLTGKLDGGGLEQTSKAFHIMGLRPGRQHAIAAGVTELAAGTAQVLGLWTPAASAAIAGSMTVAIAKVNGPRGPWASKGGYEYPATLVAIALALAALGPGHLAVDGTLTKRRAGLGWALAAATAGGAMGAAVVVRANRNHARDKERRAAEKAAAAAATPEAEAAATAPASLK